MLAILLTILYTIIAVALIAMKREVAAANGRFSVERMSSQETGDKSLYHIRSTSKVERRAIRYYHMTRPAKCTVTACRTEPKCEKEATFFMASQVMRITLKAYDHELVDASAKKIIETVKKNGAQVSGPVPLPTKKEVITILRAVHKYKDSREQFEQRTHKRLIDIITPTQKTVDALSRLEMPAGVYIDIKMKTK